ncbi:MAG: DUF3048 domain-containing protein [Clostridiales bacterium]|jgi:hypothetical protein|nr:DUF3048 domain-containing protein [Clostridiales bacterium]
MRKIYIVLLAFTLLGIAGCSRKEAEAFVEEDIPVYTPPVYNKPAVGMERAGLPTESAFDMPGYPDRPLSLAELEQQGLTLSRLTGLPIPMEDANRRPVAAVINNHNSALPQSGISQADIIHEVLAEGEITRLVAIFQSFGAEKIGPVRSAREYFADIATDYDAIFVHHGGSPSGYTRLRNLGINRLDGLTLEGTYFWRDRTYPDWDAERAGRTRSMEHSSYTSAALIKTASGTMGFRETLYEDAYLGFIFDTRGGGAKDADDAEKIAAGNGSAADLAPAADFSAREVRVPFSNSYVRTFVYDGETGLYAVYNQSGAHMDALGRVPMQVKNILIQSVSMRLVPGDTEGRREVGVIGSGTGLLINGGAYREVRWEKKDQDSPTVWYDGGDGMPLLLQPGRTWICMFQQNGEVEIN